MDDNAQTHCPTCLLIRVRDTSQEAIGKSFDESPPSDPDVTEYEVDSYSRPFELEEETHPVIS